MKRASKWCYNGADYNYKIQFWPFGHQSSHWFWPTQHDTKTELVWCQRWIKFKWKRCHFNPPSSHQDPTLPRKPWLRSCCKSNNARRIKHCGGVCAGGGGSGDGGMGKEKMVIIPQHIKTTTEHLNQYSWRYNMMETEENEGGDVVW